VMEKLTPGDEGEEEVKVLPNVHIGVCCLPADDRLQGLVPLFAIQGQLTSPKIAVHHAGISAPTSQQ
jgi:hypothetical protein